MDMFKCMSSYQDQQIKLGLYTRDMTKYPKKKGSIQAHSDNSSLEMLISAKNYLPKGLIIPYNL